MAFRENAPVPGHMELTAIPGVGEKTAAALASLEDPETAIERGNVAAIADAPGISPGRAAHIVRGAIRERFGDESKFLRTARAAELYETLLDLLQAEAVTTYGRHRLSTFYPTGNAERLAEARERTTVALDRDPDPGIAEELSGVALLEEPDPVTIRDRCVATADAEQYAAAQDRLPELSIELVEDRRDLAELARGYATVVVLDERFAGLDLDGDVRVEPDVLEDPARLVPERTLSFFAANRDSIQAAIAVHRRTDLTSPTDLDQLEEAIGRLDADGTPIGDDELDRLTAAVEDLDASVATAESVADDRLRAAIRERDVTIEGTDLLSLVERGAGVDSLLRRELVDEFERAVSAARDHLQDALQLTDDRTHLADGVFPDDPTFPVTTDDDAVGRLRRSLQRARDRRAERRKRELADVLRDERAAAHTLVHTALELDVDRAIASFADRYDCTMPTFEGSGIEIIGGRSPLLDCPPEAVEPVEYAVEDVVLLSGVNSGGKTSLLDLLAATAILAHMGLPVPADSARLERFEGLHYQAATQGTVDAGAFESTVRSFGELTAEANGALVLVDELESITEPGAAATIVAGILEELHGETTGVFVSHLAAEIRDATTHDVRVDGIAAEGLVDGELVVDRTPVRDHLARSTPELIVEGLAQSADGPAGTLYTRLLDKFETDDEPL